MSSLAITDPLGNTAPVGYQGPVVAVQPTVSPSLPEVWHYVGGTNALGTALGSGWTNYGHSYPGLAFRLLPTGNVEIIGCVAPGTVSTTIFTLPAGYRPATQQMLPYTVIASTGAAPYPWPVFNVLTTGAVTQNGTATPSTTVIWIHGEISLTV